MIDVAKVKSTHTRRDAIVYIRQSHPSQVENNRESTARQYALMEKAMALGWAIGPDNSLIAEMQPLAPRKSPSGNLPYLHPITWLCSLDIGN